MANGINRPQDDAPPDVRLFVAAVIRTFGEILDGPATLHAETLNRVAGLRRAAERLRDSMEREDP